MRNKAVIFGLYTIVAGVILYIAFYKVIQFPEHYLFGDSGDGLKNYFTFVDYVRHGHGTHFTGMNYPYGEHVIFTDNQPVIAFIFNWINHNIIDISNNMIGIYNLLMIFSIFLTGLFILKILYFLELPDWYAVTFSILIIFLSPQLLRLPGHFTLSYGFIIPAIWYYLLRIFNDDSKPVHYFGLGFVFLFSSFIHLYFFAINIILIWAFSFFAVLFFKKKIIIRTLTTLGLTTILMLFVILFIKFTDNVPDRPAKPWGIDYYNASFESIFLPNSGFLHDFLAVGNQKTEGIAYVGIIGLLFIAAFTVFIIYVLIKNRNLLFKHFSQKKITKEKLLTVSILTAIATVLYSSHFYHNIGVFDIFPGLGSFGQFRSIGRFAWIFYYIYTVFFSYYIYRFFDIQLQKGRHTVAFLTLIFVVAIWSIESKQNFSKSVKHIFNQNTILTSKDKTYIDILKKRGKSPTEFQAILQLPLVIIGNERWNMEEGQWAMRQTFKCSFQTGLPIMDIMMSRTSLSQSLDLVQLLGTLPIEHKRLKKMDNRPLLVICDTTFENKIDNNICKKGFFIDSIDGLRLFELPVDSLKPNLPYLANKYSIPNDTIYLEGAQGYYAVDNFENKNSSISFNGKGAKFFKDTTVFCTEIPKDTQRYEISLWLYFDPLNEEKPEIYNYNFDHKTSGNIKIPIASMTDTKGYWIRLKVEVDSGMEQCLKIKGQAYIDAILVKPVNSHLIMKKGDKLYYDNCEVD